MKKILFFVLLLFVFGSCNSQNCKEVNNKEFKSYSEAKEFVLTNNFKFTSKEDLQRSSWIKKANYYSCDGVVGYFSYETKTGKDYIYRNVPMKVWQGFKNSNSPGRFYNENIKGRFVLVLDE